MGELDKIICIFLAFSQYVHCVHISISRIIVPGNNKNIHLQPEIQLLGIRNAFEQAIECENGQQADRNSINDYLHFTLDFIENWNINKLH